MLPAGTHGFSNTKYMWDTGHFKTLIDLDEYGRGKRPCEPHCPRPIAREMRVCQLRAGGCAIWRADDPRTRRWTSSQAKVLALNTLTARCDSEAVSFVDPAASPVLVSFDIPCTQPDSHYTTNALARFGSTIFREHHASSTSRAPLFMVISIPDPHPMYKTRKVRVRASRTGPGIVLAATVKAMPSTSTCATAASQQITRWPSDHTRQHHRRGQRAQQLKVCPFTL